MLGKVGNFQGLLSHFEFFTVRSCLPVDVMPSASAHNSTVRRTVRLGLTNVASLSTMWRNVSCGNRVTSVSKTSKIITSPYWLEKCLGIFCKQNKSDVPVWSQIEQWGILSAFFSSFCSSHSLCRSLLSSQPHTLAELKILTDIVYKIFCLINWKYQR